MEYTKPSHLQEKSINEIQNMAMNIASESFIKHGNNMIPFTQNNELRNLLGGRWQSYPELAAVVIAAYNDKYMYLVLGNI